MNVTLYNGKSGMNAFQKKMDVISNNISNLETSGYKEVNVTFQELLRDEIGELGTPLSKELENKNPTAGSGAKVGDTYRNFEQGNLTQSPNTLEIAIDGNGLMGFRDANDNLLLSRVGDLSINQQGNLVDQNGNLLEVENGIDLRTYKANQIEINSSGEITVKDEISGTLNGGKIILYDTVDRSGLKEMGQNYFVGDPKELFQSNSEENKKHFGKIIQGFSEASNVDIGKEMVEMITTNRAYQFNAKSIEAADEMWKMANSLRG